jgi:Spy/CpxP family protein refolding chaperone
MKHPFFGAFTIAVLAVGGFGHRIIAEEPARESPAQAAVFVPFDFYPRHREELGLNEEQGREMQRIAEGMRETASKFEAERAGRTKALQEVMSQNPVDVQRAMDCFHAVLNAENELKALQFHGGLAMRNTLSPEQFGKLQSLATKESTSRRVEVRAEFHERIQQLKREVHQRLGGEPPPEIIERIKQIEELAKEGRLGDAKNQLEQVLRRLRNPSGPADESRVGGKPTNR